jgi:predicted 3-demethylubiquinone-9 3-methyltransferase (glyoxalase superfamily)
MPTSITPFLMFQGEAEAAVNFYTSLVDDARLIHLERFSPGEAGREGTVKAAEFCLCGQTFRCFDSPPVHDFGFTPSISLFVDCTSIAEVDALFGRLSEDGKVLMPPDDYGFSPRFAWVDDRFGVSWQLSAPAS